MENFVGGLHPRSSNVYTRGGAIAAVCVYMGKFFEDFKNYNIRTKCNILNLKIVYLLPVLKVCYKREGSSCTVQIDQRILAANGTF